MLTFLESKNINPFKTAKAVTNGNQRLSKIETRSKASLKLTSRINLNSGHSPQVPHTPHHSLERVN